MWHSPKGQPLQSLSQSCQDEGHSLHMAGPKACVAWFWFIPLAVALHHAPSMHATPPEMLNFFQTPKLPPVPGLQLGLWVSAFDATSSRKQPLTDC